MKTNKKPMKKAPVFTHEGARASQTNAEQQLRRSVMACMLWEDEFYESGQSIAYRIAMTIPDVKPEKVAAIAIEAREQMKLRHVPLLIVRLMAALPTHRHLVAETLSRVIQRVDELTEFVSIYWKVKRQPLSAQAKKGLALAFPKFSAYQLAKYNRDEAVKLRDVLFLSHAKPKDKEQEAIWKQLVDGTLPSPDTWEVALSVGKDKKTEFTRLIEEGKLGALAMLRNLRNMEQSKVDPKVIRRGLSEMKTERVLPFRFISAARHAPQFEPELEAAMLKSASELEKLPGTTVICVDTSGSMSAPVSAKSDISRRDAAAALAMLLREVCENCHVVAFGDQAGVVRPRRGFALNDEIGSGKFGHGTNIELAVQTAYSKDPDRIIVVTDEQSAARVTAPRKGVKGYMINVASTKNGVGYGAWNHIDGWSEAILSYIAEFEKQ